MGESYTVGENESEIHIDGVGKGASESVGEDETESVDEDESESW